MKDDIGQSVRANKAERENFAQLLRVEWTALERSAYFLGKALDYYTNVHIQRRYPASPSNGVNNGHARPCRLPSPSVITTAIAISFPHNGYAITSCAVIASELCINSRTL